MTAPTYIRVWVRVRHGKKTKNELVVAGAIPKGINIPRSMHFEIKRLVRDEWQRTGRIVPTERVEGIIAATRLAHALT